MGSAFWVSPCGCLTADNQEEPPPGAPGQRGSDAGQSGETKGKIGLSESDDSGRWAPAPFGKTSFVENAARRIRRGGTGPAPWIVRSRRPSCSVKPAGHSTSATTLKVENRLPFTLATVEVKAGTSSGSPTVPFAGLGHCTWSVGRGLRFRPGGKVEHVELNGL